MAAHDSNSGAQVITRPCQRLRLKAMGPTSVSITTLSRSSSTRDIST